MIPAQRWGRSSIGSTVLVAGAALAWSNAVLPRLDRRWSLGSGGRAAATLGFSAVGAALVRTRIPAALGVAAGAGVAVVGLGATTSVHRDSTPVDLARWVLLEIPLGTVLPEELLFRWSITPGFRAAIGDRAGAIAGAVTFGLWHVGAAGASHQPVFPTVVVTSVGGACFDELNRRTRRSWPSFVAHAILNGAGAILSSG